MDLIGGFFLSLLLVWSSKVQLSRVGDNNNLLQLDCDCAISFVSQVVVEGVKKRGDKTS